MPHLSDSPRRADDAPLTFAQWCIGIGHRWRLTVGVAGVVVAAFVAAALVLPPSYRAEASFVSNAGDGAKLPSSLAGMAGLAGMASSAGIGLGADPSESPAFYTQLIQSRELLTRLLESRFADYESPAPTDSAALVDVLRIRPSEPRARRIERGVERMRKTVAFTADPRTNLIELDVELPDGELAAGVANRVVELVSEFNKEQRVSRARAKREFLESRYREAEASLRAAEARERSFLVRNRILRSPQLEADADELQRSVDLAEDLFRTLRRELETARIDEVNTAPVITVVDRAIPPQRPRWPRPIPLAALALTAGALLGLLAAGAATLAADWARRNPDDAAAARALGHRSRRRARTDDGPATSGSDGDERAAAARVRARSGAVG